MINKRLLKNSKAISPIFATLILIAIAVIAGVVVYMYTSGTLSTMTGNTSAAQEKVAVQGVDAANVYAQNMGTAPVDITGVFVKDQNGVIVASATGTATDPSLVTINPNSLGSVACPTSTEMAAGQSYTVTLSSAKGGSFVSASFVYTPA